MTLTPIETLISEGQLAFSVVLAAVTVWYAYETAQLRKETSQMRKMSERQVLAMEASMQLSIADREQTYLPYLTLGILPVSDTVSERLESQSATSYIDLTAAGIGGPSVRIPCNKSFLFSASNVTSQLANSIFMVYFDRNRQIYISCVVGEIIGPKEQILLPMSRESVSVDNLKEIVTKIFEARGKFLVDREEKASDGRTMSILDIYADSDDRHLLAIFFSLSGKLYAIPRVVVKSIGDDGNEIFAFGKSDLITEQFEFAPTLFSLT